MKHDLKRFLIPSYLIVGLSSALIAAAWSSEPLVWVSAAAALAICTALIKSNGIRSSLQELMDFLSGKRAVLEGNRLTEVEPIAAAIVAQQKEHEKNIQDVLSKKTQSDAVLSSMVEGVVAVDREERILQVNQAARNMLCLDSFPSAEPSVQEAIRNTEFQEMVKKAIASHHAIEGEVKLLDENGSILQVNASPLQDAKGESIGAVLVFHDITKLRRLETIRRDFVANVSHELKTPITSIKGFVETLLDGALEDAEDARRFLGIVAKQSERLSTIIEDLLSLSRLEQDNDSEHMHFEEVFINDVVERACQTCLLKAKEKEVMLRIQCDEDLLLKANSHLLEQATVNLVSNAIKYSHEEGEVVVAASKNSREVLISVQDFGIGIPREHFPRLFERFYRVDKARSRTLGGTGLGLAIVKHIAQAHRGYVRVESTPGEGSVFTLHLPRSAEQAKAA